MHVSEEYVWRGCVKVCVRAHMCMCVCEREKECVCMCMCMCMIRSKGEVVFLVEFPSIHPLWQYRSPVPHSEFCTMSTSWKERDQVTGRAC